MIGQHRRNKRAERLACLSSAERHQHIHRIARLHKKANARKILTFVFKDALPFVKDPPKFISEVAEDIPNWLAWSPQDIQISDITVTGEGENWTDLDDLVFQERVRYLTSADQVTLKFSDIFPLPVSHNFLSDYQREIINPKGFINATKNIKRDKKALTLLGKLLVSSFQQELLDEYPDGEFLIDDEKEIQEKIQEVEDPEVRFQYKPGKIRFKPTKFKATPHGILFWAWGTFKTNPYDFEVDESYYDDF